MIPTEMELVEVLEEIVDAINSGNTEPLQHRVLELKCQIVVCSDDNCMRVYEMTALRCPYCNAERIA